MIRFSKVSKRYDGAAAPVVDNIDLEVPEGEICVLLGPSGCGKTTTLKMINRLIQPSEGKIFVDGVDTGDMDVVELRRRIGYVIQQIGLFPNMTIEDNLCVVPKLLGWSRKRSRQRAAELLEMVALEPSLYLSRYPKDLSGGQQQRVGVARALATDPPVMLMDEPFGAIDPINRAKLQDEFLKIQQQVRKTIVFVSHDIDEAVRMADRIAIFRAGRLEQVDTPDAILARPASTFVADFVGADRALRRLRLSPASRVVSAADCAVQPGDTEARAVELMAEHGFREIVLLDAAGRPQGWLSAERLDVARCAPASAVSSPSAGFRSTALGGVARQSDDLRAVVSAMFASGRSCLAAVDDDGRFVGYVQQAHIVDLLNRDSEVTT